MECKICFEPFDSKYFIPKLLPKCGHSFCRICLERLMNKKSNVNCPVCREMTLNYKDNTLPTNYSLLEIMDKSSSNEKTKNLLEKYKYFDENNYSCLLHQINRAYEPKILTLKKIVNDDFIYMEEFETNRNISIFNEFKQRNRSYNFNKKSLFRYFFNEYSYFSSIYQKSSKCKHEFSCVEAILRKAVFSFCVGYFSGLFIQHLLKFSPIIKFLSEYGVNSDNVLGYKTIFQYAISGIMLVPNVFSCLVGLYIDDLLILS